LNYEETQNVPEGVYIHEGKKLSGEATFPLLSQVNDYKSALENHGQWSRHKLCHWQSKSMSILVKVVENLVKAQT
jgi:hypothetical protein